MIIGVDFDNVLFRTGDIWARWLTGLSGRSKVPLKNINYDLLSYYEDEVRDSDGALNKEMFFDRVDLYARQTIWRTKDSMRELTQLHNIGHKIWILTDCSPINYQAKLIPARKLFMADRVIRTNDKGKYDVDIMIDDRNEYLNQFADKPNTILIKYDTKYKQTEKLIRGDVILSGDWKWISSFIMKESAKRGENL